MAVLPDLTKLCTPAQLYLFITLFSLVVMIFQNGTSHSNVLCVGNYECHNSPSKSVLVFVKIIYISFWTFVLQMICKGGYKNFAWFLVLLPIVIFMLLLIFAIGPWTYTGNIVEGMTNINDLNTPKDGANYVAENVNNKTEQLKKSLEKNKKNNSVTREQHKSTLLNIINLLNNTAKTSANKVK
jgi:predicted PurR-regulated permease PerM